jgi:hypothetical protein
VTNDLKRYEVKYIRDGIKSRYKKGTECEICGSTDKLDFHHWYSLAELYNKWARVNKIKVTSAEQIFEIRERFYAEYEYELLEAASTLCHAHHEKLHGIYGRNPSLATAKKQEKWIAIQKEKHNGTPIVDS